ncbi:unnamed protein product [Pleuronectes platessa]|uniref:MADF domain-containing protein n=1 Tax=Pleuronectes platessa TaxID=8262 RepID=A0A9N7Z080_PLEPL|nr:unnamed protein product [Pleuronectes platessa]
MDNREELLSEEVRKYEHFYNPSMSEYKDTEMASNSWKEISANVAEKIDSTPKRSLHGARQPRHNATLQPPACSALRFNMGVDGGQRIGAALTPRFGVASASGVNPA